MKPYHLKAPLMRKEPEIHFDTCQVDHVITLSEPVFREFQHSLMTDRDFLREFNREYVSSYTEGVRPGLLVLGEGSDDGIFVCTEGYDYARYSAYVPNARQILLLKEYPSLQDYGKEVAYQVDRSIQKALTVGLPDDFRFSLEDVQHQAFPYDFNVDLFLEMLGNRPEVENVDIDGNEVILTISQEFLPTREQSLRTISDEDFKIACAKHLLWSYGLEASRQISPTVRSTMSASLAWNSTVQFLMAQYSETVISLKHPSALLPSGAVLFLAAVAKA